MASLPKVAIIAHGHPDYSAGGGEMAAYSHFSALQAAHPGSAHLIAWVDPARMSAHTAGAVTRLRPEANEWLYRSSGAEWLYQLSSDREKLSQLATFIAELNVDVIHIHHYLGFGLDLIRFLRLEMPNVKIIVTLHEFLSICLQDGQMVTRQANRLCTSASTVKCMDCFPELHRSHFALREEWFKRHFDLVDHFLSPSAFLRDRFVAWGLAPDRISVLENAQICVTEALPPPVEDGSDLYATFAFFGQINPYKGADILAQAAKILAKSLKRRKTYDGPQPKILFFGTMKNQTPEFQEQMQDAFKDAGDIVKYKGSYDRHEVLNLMSSAGWVIVPSTWWENSPVVIEEAFHARRPVICSDIGGMREKVTDGVNGFHFRARDPADLARVLERCLDNPELWQTMRRGVRHVPTLQESANSHYEIYERARARTGA